MKLLVCDVEGTIFKAEYRIKGTEYASTMWQPLALALGEVAVEEESNTHEKWKNNEYGSYLEWVEDSIEIHKKYSLKEKTFNNLIEKAEYNEGVVEFFRNLDRTKYIPVLVSGGFQELIRRAQVEVGIDYGFGACEYYFDDEGYLDHYNLQPTDFEDKYNFVKLLFNQFNINRKKDWIFIGDGKNDVHIAKKAPIKFAINPHPELLDIDDIIEINSFSEVMDFIDSHIDKEDKEKKDNVAELDSIDEASEKSEDETIILLKKRISDLEKYNRKLKQDYNDLAVKTNAKEKSIEIKVREIDYKKTPKRSLKEILSEYKIAFVGLKKEYRNYQYLKRLSKNLVIINWEDNNFDTSVIESADFLFIYKDCISHSAVNRIFKKNTPPYAKLSRHRNEELLENVMANILGRVMHGDD